VIERMRATTLFDIRPSRMRQYVPTAASVLGVNGENASAVLWRLCQDPERKQEVLDWLSELCAPELVDIRFSETDLNEVLLVLVEKDGTSISARGLSDGTLRFLGLLLALLTAQAGSILLLEEIENGLHPARIHLLIELLERVTKENGVQVIATTHSPVVLGALARETLGNTIVFGRHPDRPGSIMKRLADLPQFDEIVVRRGIEHLFTTKWLERAL
jgi:predicted ATPase